MPSSMLYPQSPGKHINENTIPDQAPNAGCSPKEYPLLPGTENVLQTKLDLWNRLQLAHGFMPAFARLVVSLGIVGGTIYGGFTAMATAVF